jgi:hypothetical protein
VSLQIQYAFETGGTGKGLITIVAVSNTEAQPVIGLYCFTYLYMVVTESVEGAGNTVTVSTKPLCLNHNRLLLASKELAVITVGVMF